MSAQVKVVQGLLDEFFDSRNLQYKRLARDGVPGPITRRKIRLFRFYDGLRPGYGPEQQESKITAALIAALQHPRARIRGFTLRQHAARLVLAGRRQRARRAAIKAKKKRAGLKGTTPGPPHWSGSRYVLEETLPIARRYGAPLTSTKRAANHPLSRSNPGSDHNEANRTAYAHDYATFHGGGLSTAIRRHFGNMASGVGTYAAFYVRRAGRLFRIQTLWAVQGHYNHQHTGARA